MKTIIIPLLFFTSLASAQNCIFEGKSLAQGDLIFRHDGSKLGGPEVFVACGAFNNMYLAYINLNGDLKPYKYSEPAKDKEDPDYNIKTVGAVKKDPKFVTYCSSEATRARLQSFSRERDFGSAEGVLFGTDKTLEKCKAANYTCGIARTSVYRSNLGGVGEFWSMCRGMGLNFFECLSETSQAVGNTGVVNKRTDYRRFGYTTNVGQRDKFLQANPTACADNRFCQGTWYGHNAGGILKTEAQLLGCQ